MMQTKHKKSQNLSYQQLNSQIHQRKIFNKDKKTINSRRLNHNSIRLPLPINIINDQIYDETKTPLKMKDSYKNIDDLSYPFLSNPFQKQQRPIKKSQSQKKRIKQKRLYDTNKIVSRQTLVQASKYTNRQLMNSLKQQFISIYVKQKLLYENKLRKRGIKQQVQDNQFKLFIAKLAIY